MRNRPWLIEILILIVVAVFTYLPLVNQIGYTHDDWYLMYSAGAHGPNVFRDIFSVDRPGRVLVMIPAYILFGANPLFYHLSAFLLRVIGALALFWTLNQLWGRRTLAPAVMSLLFLIYPGFLSTPNAIDYQSHIAGLAAALLSVGLTIRAMLSEARLVKVALHAASVLFGWLYLSQMEWYIGFEFFRWACIFVLSSRLGGTLFQKGLRAVRAAYPSLAIPVLFLVWRLFFFESERAATDTTIQLEQLRLYPVQTVYHWAVQVIQDFFDVFLSAWVIPLSQVTSYIQAWGSLIAAGVVGLVLFFFLKRPTPDLPPDSSADGFSREALWLGFWSAVAGLIPIAMVNREVAFPAFSRYSLVSSVGAAILLTAILFRVRGRFLRSAILAGLLFIALLTHHANSIRFARETAALRNFWWQVSWRVPQIEPRTTITGYYPLGAVEEDYFLWGPANLIYYPQKESTREIVPTLFAAILNRDTVSKVLTREPQEYDNRKNIVTYKNYRNILIFTQPTPSSCVHVIDGVQPMFSQWELDSVRLIGTYSESERILLEEAPQTPPALVFGSEPLHDWCYYYQKADLARQRGDWETVLAIGEEASEKGFAPVDRIEWMPFLLAYAQTDHLEKLAELAAEVTASPYVARQTCQIIGATPGLSKHVIEVVDSMYCLE